VELVADIFQFICTLTGAQKGYASCLKSVQQVSLTDVH